MSLLTDLLGAEDYSSATPSPVLSTIDQVLPAVNQSVDIFSRVWSIVQGKGDPINVANTGYGATAKANQMSVILIIAALAAVVVIALLLLVPRR